MGLEMKKERPRKNQEILDRKLREIEGRFKTEDDCINYLRDWQLRRGYRCNNCGHNECNYVSSRSLFQCKKCKAQSSLRTGTVFHRRQNSLLKWFTMVLLIAQTEFEVSTVQLKETLNFDRYDTAREMRKEIEGELTSSILNDYTQKLAGLVTAKDFVLCFLRRLLKTKEKEEKAERKRQSPKELVKRIKRMLQNRENRRVIKRRIKRRAAAKRSKRYSTWRSRIGHSTRVFLR